MAPDRAISDASISSSDLASPPVTSNVDESFEDRLRELVGDPDQDEGSADPPPLRAQTSSHPSPVEDQDTGGRWSLITTIVLAILVFLLITGGIALVRQFQSNPKGDTATLEAGSGPATSTPEPAVLVPVEELGRVDEPPNPGEVYPDRPGTIEQDRERVLGEPARIAGYTATVDSVSHNAAESVQVRVSVLNRTQDQLPIDPFHWKLQSPSGRIDPPVIGGEDPLRPERLVSGTGRTGQLLFEVPADVGGYFIIYEPERNTGDRAVWRHDLDNGEDASGPTILLDEISESDNSSNPGQEYPGRGDELPGDVEVQPDEIARVAGYSARIEAVSFEQSVGPDENDGYLKIAVTIFNRNDDIQPYNLFDWRLETPSGGLEPLLVISRPRIDRGELVEGGQLTGDIYFQAATPPEDDTFLMYEPDPFTDNRAVWKLPPSS